MPESEMNPKHSKIPIQIRSVAGATCLAFLAGCATDADRKRLRALAEQAWPAARIALGSDRDSGLATAFRDGDGIGNHGTHIR